MSTTHSASNSVLGPDRVVIKEPGPYRCPRCPVELPRVEFVKHLWLEHRLVLDGQAIREPWRLVEEWAEEYSRSGDPELLTRCQVFGQRLDPDQGPLRVQRVFLAHRIETEPSRQVLLAEARARRVSVCPRCLAFVNAPEETPAQPLDLSPCPPSLAGKGERGLGCRLAKNGYRMEIEERGLFCKLVVETPSQLIYRGWEPGQRLTFAGAVFLLAGPFVLAALLLAVFAHPDSPPTPPLYLPPASGGDTEGGGEVSPLAPVAFLLFCSIGAYFLSHWRWQSQWLDRAGNYGWTMLVPRLELSGFMSEDIAFLASLAWTSIGRGQPAARSANLARVVKYAEKVVAAGTVPVTHLAAFWRLILEDKARMGEDVVRLAAAQVARSFAGELPLSFAESLLTPISPTSEVLKASEVLGLSCQNRLRILLCERAFEAGFEVRDLTEMAKIAPFLSQAMQTSDINGLAGLRLLWSLRPRRPWDHLGPVETVFDLAARHGQRHSERSEESPQAIWSRPFAALRVTSRRGNQNGVLEEYPDLLLAAADGSELHLCARGVVFQSQLFTQPPRSIQVKKRVLQGWELVIEDRRFQYFRDPAPIAQRLERWFRYYFGDWTHQISDVFNWRSPGLPANFRLRKTYPCPECRLELYPRVGDLAITT